MFRLEFDFDVLAFDSYGLVGDVLRCRCAEDAAGCDVKDGAVPRAIAAAGTHVEISAAVKVGSNQSFFCSVTPTLEVFDGVTGATMAILENANSLPRLIFSPVPLN